MKAGFAALGEVAEFINGAAFKPSDWGDVGKKIIRIQNLTDSSKPYNKTRRSVNKKLTVNYGDILVSWSATLGVFVWTEKEEAVLNQHIFKVIHNSKIIDKNYLRHCLHQALDAMTKHLHGATMKHVNRGEFLATQIPLPPLAEQQRIAELLDTVDRILKLRESAIAKLDQLAQSVFVDYLKTEPDKKIKKLEDCVFDMHQGINTVTENIDYKNSGYPIIQSKHITSGYLSLDDVRYVSDSDFKKYKIKYKPDLGDLLLCNIGTIGKSIAINVDVNFLVAWNLFLIKVDKNLVSPTYLKFYLDHLFNTKYFEKFLTGGTVKFISKKSLSATLIELPSLSSQQVFVESITKIENLRKIYIKSLSYVNLLNKSLQHQSFAVN